MDERREHPRAGMHATAVVIARHNDGVPMIIESLSMGGARLVGALTVNRGDRVQILFELAGRPIEVRGEVVRNELRDMTTDVVSVRFVELTDEAREQVRELVRDSMEHDGRELLGDGDTSDP